MVELLLLIFVVCAIFIPPFARNWALWAVMLGVGSAVLLGVYKLMIFASSGRFLEDTMTFLVVVTGGWFGLWGMAIQAAVLLRGADRVWATRAIGWGLMAGATALVLLQV